MAFFIISFCHNDEMPTSKIYVFYGFKGTYFFIYLFNSIDFSFLFNLTGFFPLNSQIRCIVYLLCFFVVFKQRCFSLVCSCEEELALTGFVSDCRGQRPPYRSGRLMLTCSSVILPTAQERWKPWWDFSVFLRRWGSMCWGQAAKTWPRVLAGRGMWHGRKHVACWLSSGREERGRITPWGSRNVWNHVRVLSPT